MNPKSFKVLAYAGHGTNDIYFFILPPLLPLILAQYHLKYAAAGGVLTLFFAVIALFSFVLGKLSDRLSKLKVIAAGFWVASGGLLLSSLSLGPVLFLAFLLLAAVGVSTFHPVIYSLLEESIPGTSGHIFGIFEFWGSFSLFFMFLINGTLLRFLPWERILILTSLPGFLMGFFFLRFADRSTSPAAGPGHRAKETKGGGSSRVLMLFLLAITVRAFSILGVISFLPTYLVREIGVSSTLAAYAGGLNFLGSLLILVFVGKIIDRWGPFPVLVLSAASNGLLILLLSLAGRSWTLPLLVVVMGGLSSITNPAQNLLLSRLSGRWGRGTVFGFGMGMISLASAFSPGILGFIADRLGLRGAFAFFALPVLASCFLFLGLSRTRSKG